MFKCKRSIVVATICTIASAFTALAVIIKINKTKTRETITQAYEKYILDHKY